MIAPFTLVQYLDINDGEPRYTTIEKLYQEYSYKSKVININNTEISEINFADKPHVKITDLFGWTDILAIRKVKLTINNFIWNTILVADKQISVDNSELIPCYDISTNKIGFHGEVKYPYTLKNPTKINIYNDYLRIRDSEDLEGNRIEFATPIFLISDGFGFDGNTVTGFNLVTKSRFFNGNDVHLFASDEITIDEASKWYK